MVFRIDFIDIYNIDSAVVLGQLLTSTELMLWVWRYLAKIIPKRYLMIVCCRESGRGEFLSLRYVILSINIAYGRRELVFHSVALYGGWTKHAP